MSLCNEQSCVLHHLRLPTLPSTPILSQGGYFRELTRSCQTVVLHRVHPVYGYDGLPMQPSAESPGYVVESDPEEDPEEYEDDKMEDGPIDYPMDGGEDGDDDDSDSPGDDPMMRMRMKRMKMRRMRRRRITLASADFRCVVPILLSLITVRRLQASIAATRAKVERLLAMAYFTNPLQGSVLLGYNAPFATYHYTTCAITITTINWVYPTQMPDTYDSLRQALMMAGYCRITITLHSQPLPPISYIPPPVDRQDDIPESDGTSKSRVCLLEASEAALEIATYDRGRRSILCYKAC
ncbi:hypothetical protein Tco_0597073 [Tanacetum coccineum]